MIPPERGGRQDGWAQSYTELPEAVGAAERELHARGGVDQVGGGFDAESVDLEAVNCKVAVLRARRKGRRGGALPKQAPLSRSA
jgi:hypothetical protein